MMNLNRLDFEIPQLEGKLNGLYMEKHHEVTNAHGPGRDFTESKRLRWLSASIWLKEQAQDPDALMAALPDPGEIRRELHGEVKAIMSDYGNLSLEGLRLFLGLLAAWLLLMNVVAYRLNLVLFSVLILGCMVLYPIGIYGFWNRGSLHPFKVMKLGITTVGVLSAWAGIYLMGQFNRQNPLFEGIILSPFNFTEFLILVNLVIFLSFVIHYRRANLFSEVSGNYRKHLLSLSGLNHTAQDEINEIMKGLEPIPLKTHTRRRLKTALIEEYTRSGKVAEDTVRNFIRANCINMNWMYWSGSIVQWTIVILLISKLVWARDTGLMVSADYFRQELNTGMVLGAMLISAGVFCPFNLFFRELLYQGAIFSLKQAWLLMGLAFMCVSVTLLSGLVPSRFIWGIPLNPAPHLWGFVILLSLVLLLQFFKSDTRFQIPEKEKK